MSSKKTVPLHVTVRLTDGRLNLSGRSDLILLDGMLLHGDMQKRSPGVFRDERYPHAPRGALALPVSTIGDQTRILRASRAAYHVKEVLIEHINKRFDFTAADRMPHLADEKGQISDSVGKFRAHRVPQKVAIVECGIVEFWACARPDFVRDVLQYIPHIGKKGAVGYGDIAFFEVEEIEQDYSIYHPDHGLMRPVPVDLVTMISELAGVDLSRYRKQNFPLIPPYHNNPEEHRLDFFKMNRERAKIRKEFCDKYDLNFIGMCKHESKARKMMLRRKGLTYECVTRDGVTCCPLGDLTHEDIWAYIHRRGLRYLEIYDHTLFDRQRLRSEPLILFAPKVAGILHFELRELYPDYLRELEDTFGDLPF